MSRGKVSLSFHLREQYEPNSGQSERVHQRTSRWLTPGSHKKEVRPYISLGTTVCMSHLQQPSCTDGTEMGASNAITKEIWDPVL